MAVETRKVRALSARTHFVPGHGQVHFDPDSKKEEVRYPQMPVDVIDDLVEWGWIADDVPPEAATKPRKPLKAAAADQAPAA